MMEIHWSWGYPVFRRNLAFPPSRSQAVTAPAPATQLPQGDQRSPVSSAMGNPLSIGDFLKWGYPKLDGLYGKILARWMILGYPYFRKPPNGDSNGKIMHEYREFCPSPCVFHPRLSCREQPRSVWIGGRSEGRNVCFLLEHHTLVEAPMVLF